MTLKVLNPIPGGATHISYRRAARYIRAGRAELIKGGLLRFREDHHANRAAAAQRHTCGGYDRGVRNGIATDEQLAGVPIVKPRELTAPRGRLNPRPMYMRASDVNGTNCARA